MRLSSALAPSRSMLVLVGLLAGCGDAAVTVDAGTTPDAATLTDAAVVVPPGVQLRAHAVNIVDAASAAEIREYVLGNTPQLYVGTAAFYEHFDDEYDFVYVFSDAPVDGAVAFARFTPVRRESLPSVGLAGAYHDPGYGSGTRLRGAIGVNFTAGGNGPTLHETLHYWATFLDASFGFGHDRDQPFGAHWGVAGVYGQHGGFDEATVRCSTPADAPPPCTPDPDGVIRVSTGPFGPSANGGDSLPYAPLELYLMGLLPRSEVPSPVLVLDGAHFVGEETGTGRLEFEITGSHTVSLDDIVAIHGERPPAAPGERALRAAFVAFSDAPLSAERMDALEQWAAVFGNDAPSPILLSYETATGGRATMSTRLGAVH